MKIGLLPLYIQLYDKTSPGCRPRLEGFYDEIVRLFADRNVTVVKSPFCRIKPEFEAAVASFEAAGVDAIVTLHMAYSPSLESIDALLGTELPLVVLDTTQTLEFTPQQDDGEIMYNHGIHGVMDLCSMLRRHGRAFAIAAGHYLESDCIDRVCGFVRAAVAAAALKRARVGLIGGAFAGMGDFAVSPEEMKDRFHITVESMDASALARCRAEVSQEALEAELAENAARFDLDENINPEYYPDAVRDCLALRRHLEEKGYTAFSVNFLKAEQTSGISSMPFLECCKAMERGIGYAGEGDTLTAAFTGALLSAYPETGFVEIFCPDWKNNLLFLSHMGEVNYRLADCRPLLCSAKSNLTPGNLPYIGYTRMKAGKGVYANISKDAEDYSLFLAEAEMVDGQGDRFAYSMRGWMRPENIPVARFLEEHSRNGATHHSIFVYGASLEELEFFGRLLNMKVKSF